MNTPMEYHFDHAVKAGDALYGLAALLLEMQSARDCTDTPPALSNMFYMSSVQAGLFYTAAKLTEHLGHFERLREKENAAPGTIRYGVGGDCKDDADDGEPSP